MILHQVSPTNKGFSPCSWWRRPRPAPRRQVSPHPSWSASALSQAWSLFVIVMFMIMIIVLIISHLSAAVERATIYEEHDRETASRCNLWNYWWHWWRCWCWWRSSAKFPSDGYTGCPKDSSFQNAARATVQIKICYWELVTYFSANILVCKGGAGVQSEWPNKSKLIPSLNRFV